MINAHSAIPEIHNEPNLMYAPGSPERASIQDRLERMAARQYDIPARIGGRKVRTGRLADVSTASAAGSSVKML